MAKSKDTKGYMTLNRDHTLTSTKGHSIKFEKDEPTYVPPALYSEALAIGAQTVDGKEVIEAEDAPNAVPTDPGERQVLILAAFEKLVAKNDREDFTAGGSPTVGAVKEEVGFKVDAREIATAWQVRNDLAAGE